MLGTNIPELLEGWIATHSSRIAARFKVIRGNNWASWPDQGITLDLEGDKVIGRITVWPAGASSEPWPFADVYAIWVSNGETPFEWLFQRFSTALLDK